MMTTEDNATLPAWQDPTTGQPLSIHVLMGRILAELPAIGKNQYNEQQKFSFRGIDDVKDALNPLLSKYCVFYLPDVIERVAAQRQTKGGTTMYEVSLHIRYTFHGPAGDSVTGSAWGEGTDMGDKATNKGMTGAEKQMLFQAFAIASQEQTAEDTDQHGTEETVPAIVCGTCQRAGVSNPPQFPDPRQGGDPEPYRVHMIEAHGYVRQEDGKVAAPPEPTNPYDGPDAEPPQPGPIAREARQSETPEPAPSAAPEPSTQPEAQPAPDPEPPAAPAGNPEIGEDELAYIDKMRGPALVDALKGLGEPTSGSVPEKKARLRARMAGGAPAVEVDSRSTSESTEAEKFYCPECDVFPFGTQAEYEEHWNAEHNPDNPKPQMATEAMQTELRQAVAALRDTAAREYGKWRKANDVPRIDSMTFEQATAALDYIDTLST